MEEVTMFICNKCNILLVGINFGISTLGGADIDSNGDYLMVVTEDDLEDPNNVYDIECPWCGVKCTESQKINRKEIPKILERAREEGHYQSIGIPLNDPLMMEILL